MLEIHSIEVTAFAQNARVLFDSDKNSVTVVDPGGDVHKILAVVKEYSPETLQVLLTHAHIDHGGGVANLLQQAAEFFSGEIPLIAHSEGAVRASIAQQAAVFGLPSSEFKNVPEPNKYIDDGDEIEIGSSIAKVFYTPGHAPDHVSLFLTPTESIIDSQKTKAPILIAGDALFAGSIGRTDLPGGSYPTLINSIKEKLLPLPDETIVLSGHGPNTTIGEEKRNNPFLK